MTNEEKAELEQLRAEKLIRELTEKDYMDPNVLLLEGALASYDGEWSAWSVRDNRGSLTYLSEAMEELVGWSGSIATIQWHVASEPKGFYALEENLAKVVMGDVSAQFSHAYSDLTGYLWTNEKIEVNGHDVLEEIEQASNNMVGQSYLAFRAERKKK